MVCECILGRPTYFLCTHSWQLLHLKEYPLRLMLVLHSEHGHCISCDCDCACCCQHSPCLQLSTAFFMMKSITIRKRKGERMQPCLTPVAIWKYSLFVPGILMQQLLFLYRSWKIFMYSGGMPYTSKILQSDLR